VPRTRPHSPCHTVGIEENNKVDRRRKKEGMGLLFSTQEDMIALSLKSEQTESAVCNWG
jgi:hypothetical protein